MPSPPSPVESVQVLVVGAGPVGLLTALTAARRGLQVLVLDQAFRGYATGHAALLHGRSLQLLSEAGLSIGASGRRVEAVRLHVGTAPVVDLPLTMPALALPQRVLEEALLAQLRREGVELRAPYQAVTIDQSDDHVDVRVVRRELVTLGSPAHYSEWEPVESSVVRANFVVGADGYDSRVRGALGIDAVNVGRIEAFAMFESSVVDDPGTMLHLCYDDTSSSVVLPLPDGRVRWGFQVREGLDAEADAGRLRALVARHAPFFDGPVGDVVWGSTIHFERRLARRFGKNRVWLAGDAAHVTSPLGGQSMNAGLVEAHELAHCIAGAVETGRVHDELHAYGADRAREWHKLLGVNVGFDLLPHAPAWMATHARRLLPTLPATGAELTSALERIGLALR